jgi:hypothetical protein
MYLWNNGIHQYDYTSQTGTAKTVSECSQENKQLAKFTLNKMSVLCVKDRCYETNSYKQLNIPGLKKVL